MGVEYGRRPGMGGPASKLEREAVQPPGRQPKMNGAAILGTRHNRFASQRFCQRALATWARIGEMFDEQVDEDPHFAGWKSA